MKSREERKRELQKLADTHEGCNVIVRLWNESKGLSEGTFMMGLVRQEMIPDILRHEYPNG
jgi:hypothetical protein